MKKFSALCISLVFILSIFVGCDIKDQKPQSTPDGSDKAGDDLQNTSQCDTPSSYDGIPSEYLPIIDAYIDIAKRSRYGGYSNFDPEKSHPRVKSEILTEIKNRVTNSTSGGLNSYFLSYATKDINDDGVVELFLTDRGYNIYSIFTIIDGEPVLLPLSPIGIYRRSVDRNGNIYLSMSTKGECYSKSVLRLNSDGDLYGMTYGHYDMSGFDNDDIYNYYCLYTFENPYIDTKLTPKWSCRLSDNEFAALDSSVEENRSLMDGDGCGTPEHMTRDAGLKIYEVITYHGGK